MVSKADKQRILQILRSLPREELQTILKEFQSESVKQVKKERQEFFKRAKKEPVDLEKLFGRPVSYRDEISNRANKGWTHKEIADTLNMSLYREQKLWKEAVKDEPDLRRSHLEAWRIRQREITDAVALRLERLSKSKRKQRTLETESRAEARRNIIQNQRDGLMLRYHPESKRKLGRKIKNRGSP